MIKDKIDVEIGGGLDFQLPKMVKIKQRFAGDHLEDIPTEVGRQMGKPDIKNRIKAGQRIAVGCGSRGIANIDIVVKRVIEELIAAGAKPFIFPCMGSHGAATAEGQKAVLEGYGITEKKMGVPIEATMETEIVGYLDDGMPVHMDRLAAEADGVVVVNRIKPHTSFRGATESGVTKMLSIGIGKIVGATTYHTQGMDQFPELLPKVRDCHLKNKNVLFGIGIVENAYDKTMHIEAIPSEKISTREPELQQLAKDCMPKLYFSDIDVLIVEEIGKNISGAGMDPNITGRSAVPNWGGPNVKKIVVLNLTPESHGNATGIGAADVTTMNLYKDMDVGATYANVITAMALKGGAIPVVMNTEEEAILVAVKTVVRVKPEDCRIVRIRNTLALGEIQVSDNLLSEVQNRPDQFEIVGSPSSLVFDTDGQVKRDLSQDSVEHA